MPFKVINEGFTCENCGEKNPPADKTCRNHCRKCLCSKHVDEESPGDRKSVCHGLMKPIKVIGTIDDLSIIHLCIKCGKQVKNKVASDDDFDAINKLN